MSYGGRVEAFGALPASSSVTVTNSGGTDTVVTLTAGNYTITSFVTHLLARLTAAAPPSSGAWTVTLSTGAGGTGLVTINCTGTWSMTFTTATVGTFLGYVGNIGSGAVAVTGTAIPPSLWLPKTPLIMDGHPSRAPKTTDNRSTESPSGKIITIGGTKKYVHRNLRWTHLAEADAATLETWFDSTQFGDGHAWFSRGSAFQVYWSNAGTDELVGKDLNSGTGPALGWCLAPALSSFEQVRVSDWNGMWSFTFPRIVSAG